jgi:hypothetical protein
MRKGKIIIVVLLVMLLGGAGVMFLSRDTGPPVKIYGDLSAKDVAQIKSAARRRLWHEAFPDFSMRTFKKLPRMVRRAWVTRVTQISGYNGRATAYLSGPGRTNLWDGYGVTNGPGGWAWTQNNFYIVPD